MRICAFDTETSMVSGYGRKVNPFLDKILCTGFCYDQWTFVKGVFEDDPLLWKINSTDNFNGFTNFISTWDYLVGHNLKFDLLHVWTDKELQNALKLDTFNVWDTQLVEYLLSGQQHKYPALRDIAVNKYGLAKRTKNIEENIKAGKLTQDMPINELLVDVENDVKDTLNIMKKQFEFVNNEKMSGLVETQMNFLLATTEMEFNGMCINLDVLTANQDRLTNEFLSNSSKLELVVKEQFGDLEFNSASGPHISLLFYGGKYKTVQNLPVLNELSIPVKYKSGIKRGEIKTKNTEVFIDIKGLGVKGQNETKREGTFKTDSKELIRISKSKNKVAAKTAELMLNIKKIKKQLNDYYTGTLKLLYPDNLIHGEISHCGYESHGDTTGGGTETGRTSSKNPNLQNIPRAGSSLVKEHFTSRFKDGKIIEFDFSQLEVVVFAFLTRDIKLINDIKNGVDIHKAVAAELFNKSIDEVTKEERQKIKPGTFLIIYGGGAAKLAITQGFDVEFCQKFIDVFYSRYPQTKIWQSNLLRKVEMTAKKTSRYDNKGNFIYTGHLKSITGRKYCFETEPAPQWLVDKGQKISFSPSAIKNYPVQGFATADIVPMVIGRVFRDFMIHHRHKALMINTVHDSLIIDCKKEWTDFISSGIINIMESAPKYLKHYFNIDFDLPLKVECKIGNNWRECGL